MPRRNNKNQNAIEVYGSEVKTSYLRSLIAHLIMEGKNKNDIVNWLMDEYKMPFKNAISAHRQGMVYLFLYAELTKSDILQLSMARLEQLYEMAEKDGMLKGKDFYNTLFRNIDLVNKTAGIYDRTELTDNNTDINFQLNIGAQMSPESNNKEDNGEED